jgi:hypothetical protein
MLNDIKKDATVRMAKSVDGFRQELTKLRTGRATTALVDHLKVNYYGNDMPLSQVATVQVADARSLLITPWETCTLPGGSPTRFCKPVYTLSQCSRSAMPIPLRLSRRPGSCSSPSCWAWSLPT